MHSDEQDDAHSLGNILYERRKALALTQANVADMLWKNPDAKGDVSKYEKGRFSGVLPSTVQNFCRVLKLDERDVPPRYRWNKAPKEGAISISFPKGTSLRSCLKLFQRLKRIPIICGELDEEYLSAELLHGEFAWDSIDEALCGVGHLLVDVPRIDLRTEQRQGCIEVSQRIDKNE